MRISSIRPTVHTDQFQRDVSSLSTKLSLNPFLLGNLVTEMKNPLTGRTEEIALSTTPKNIPHSLGVASQGWIIVKQSAPASIYEFQPTSDEERREMERDKHLYTKLVSSADVTVTIWFF